MRWVRFFHEVGLEDVPLVGGKNASLGEMIRELSPLGVKVPGGFATTSEAYGYFLEHNGLREAIAQELKGLDVEDPKALQGASRRLRNLILKGEYPKDLKEEILAAYRQLSEEAGRRRSPWPYAPAPPPRTCPRRALPGSRKATSTCKGKRTSSST